MTYDQIIKDIKGGQIAPIYFLFGEESYYIDLVADYIEEHLLQPHEKSFNQTILYGKEHSVAQVIDAATRLPMMADRQLVMVKEAHRLDKIEQLEGYIKNAPASTTLVLVFKSAKADKRKKFFKELLKRAVVLESKKLYDSDLPNWIQTYVKRKGFAIQQDALTLLCDYLGTDLSKVTNEISKLIINLQKGEEITTKLIERNIGISKEYNIFELQRALGSGDRTKVNRIVQYFAANEKNNPIQMVLGALYSYFTKLFLINHAGRVDNRTLAGIIGVSPYFVDEYRRAGRIFNLARTYRCLMLLSEYDLRAKGIGTGSANHGQLLKELCYKMLR